MSKSIEELVIYRIARSKETLEEAILLAQGGYWNAVANRLYYSCFYLVTALLLKNGHPTNSHNGVKTTFHREFVKRELVSRDSGKLNNRLFNLRQEGDYVDFQKFTKEEIFPFIDDVRSLIAEIEKII
ncbi:MAG: HEPN domain-containing protein [Bacteroidales bacterium]